jgi:hypothetical protein
VPPNLKRAVGANVRFGNGVWTAVILIWTRPSPRSAALRSGYLGQALPGRSAESFAGKQAHPLDSSRIAALTSS